MHYNYKYTTFGISYFLSEITSVAHTLLTLQRRHHIPLVYNINLNLAKPHKVALVPKPVFNARNLF